MDEDTKKAIEKAKKDSRKLKVVAIFIVCIVLIIYYIFWKLGFMTPGGGGGL